MKLSNRRLLACLGFVLLFCVAAGAQTVPVPTGNVGGQSWQESAGNVMGFILSAIVPGSIGVGGLMAIACVPFRALRAYLPLVLITCAAFGAFGWLFPRLLALFGVV